MKIALVSNKVPIKSFDEKMSDLKYWLEQPPVKRLEAVTFLISQTVDITTTRLDKSHVIRRKMKS